MSVFFQHSVYNAINMALLKETGTKQFANCLIILQEQKKPIQSVMNGDTSKTNTEPTTNNTEGASLTDISYSNCTSSNQVASWSHKTTLTLLKYYKEYYDKVGTQEFRSKKKFWEVLADVVNKEHNTNFLPTHCENRWRVLHRNYKKYIDVSKTDRKKRFFEYAKEMNEILGEKINIVPELCLTSTKITEENSEDNDDDDDDDINDDYSKNMDTELMEQTRLSRIVKRNAQLMKRKKPSVHPMQKSTLELMRRDKKEYYSQLLKAQNEKLMFEKEKFKQKLELEKMKVQVRKDENKVNQERNEILREYLRNNIRLPNNAYY